MKSTLQFIPTTGMSREDWLAYRHSGIGASEVGTIMGLDDYTSALELFHYKTGAAYKFDVESMSMFMGKEQEDLIATMWQYWDGSEQGMIANFRADKIIRKCQRVNAYVRNPKYPWLFVSLDRKINRQGTRGEGTLELKTISGYESEKWAAGLPPKYITQVQTQMAVCEFDWGEMAVLRDGRHMDVFPLDVKAGIVEHVITMTKDFWDRVVEGRKMITEMYHARLNFNQRRVQELEERYDEISPEPDASLAYSGYLSEKYNKPRHADRRGTSIELDWAQQHAQVSAQIKEMAEQKQLLENQLKNSMKDFQVLDFALDGKVHWSVNSAGNRTFRNKVKV